MDIKQLRYFLSLADTLHFARASVLCHVSPSTLSRNIQLLEERLGARLFERDNRRVSLTPEGLKFEPYARDAVSQWDSICYELMTDSKQLKGEISVYCSVTASYSFLYDILKKCRLRFPGIEIKLHTGAPEEAIERVLSGKDDIAIAARPDSLSPALTFQSIGLSPLVFIGPADGQVKIPETLTDWHQAPMILPERGISRERVDKWFSDKGIKPHIYSQVEGNEAIVSMVSLGFGIGVVPHIVLENSPLYDKVAEIDVTPWLPAYDVGLCAQEKKMKNPLIQAFWSLL